MYIWPISCQLFFLFFQFVIADMFSRNTSPMRSHWRYGLSKQNTSTIRGHWRCVLTKCVIYEGSLEMRFVTKLISNDYLLETQKFASDVTNLETKFFCVSNDL